MVVLFFNKKVCVFFNVVIDIYDIIDIVFINEIKFMFYSGVVVKKLWYILIVKYVVVIMKIWEISVYR